MYGCTWAAHGFTHLPIVPRLRLGDEVTKVSFHKPHRVSRSPLAEDTHGGGLGRGGGGDGGEAEGGGVNIDRQRDVEEEEKPHPRPQVAHKGTTMRAAD